MWRKQRYSVSTTATRNPILCRVSLGLLLLVVVAVLYYKASLHNFAWYNRNAHEPCETPKKLMTDLLSLSEDTHKVLAQLGMNHFLVYGSLWGGLRYNKPLPWDNDFDFGVLYSEVIQHTQEEVIDTFKTYGISCYYSNRFGFFRVTRDSARGDIMVYRDFYNSGYMHRTGWEAYLFFVNYRHFHMFPARLVQLPMPKLKFGNFNMSVPHGGVEMQKFHYPNDWWKVGKPRGC